MANAQIRRGAPTWSNMARARGAGGAMRLRVFLFVVAPWVFGLGTPACDEPASAVTYTRTEPFRVGTVKYDPDLPAEPRLPTDDEVCEVLEADSRFVKRPDGALPPEVDMSPPGVQVAASREIVNPDQDRIQAALDRCGANVEQEVGALIAEANDAANAGLPTGKPLPGASGEVLAGIRAKRYAVKLVVNGSGYGDSFISGPLMLPSGVTLWIDKGVTIFATRDATAYLIPDRVAGDGFCANTASIGKKAGSSGNCRALFWGDRLVNSAIMGDGSIDSRAYAEVVTSNALYPLMKVDMTCSNTYEAYKKNEQAPDFTACDNGGTFVNSKTNARNMTWWDLAWLGNMVQNGRTGFGSQSNFRMMFFNWAKNLTLYRITMNNSANFHCVPSGIDGLTVWGVKVQTPSRAAFANPAGNYNPLYTGFLYEQERVKNTDAFDPGSANGPMVGKLNIGGPLKGPHTTTSYADLVALTKDPEGAPQGSSVSHTFDGYLKNTVFAYNYISTGDDDIVIKASQHPCACKNPPTDDPAVDGDRDRRRDRKWGFVVAHNHIYWGHGISVGSETNTHVRNVHVYDNSIDGSYDALRIKTDNARGGEVSNVFYDRICIRRALHSLLFTPYYSTRAIDTSVGTLVPNIHDIYLKDIRIVGASEVRLEGFGANTGGNEVPENPLVMSLTNVVADDPTSVSLIASRAKLSLRGVNLPIVANAETNVTVDNPATRAVDPDRVLDCSEAFVDFPSTTSQWGETWHDPSQEPPPRH